MQTYKDPNLTLSKSKLLYFDAGYKYASVIALIHKKPQSIKYAERRLLAYFMDEVSSHSEECLVNITLMTTSLDFLPFCLLVYNERPENIVFNFSSKPTQLITSQFMKDLSARCHHRIINEAQLDEVLSITSAVHFVVADYENESKLRSIISKVAENRVNRLFIRGYTSSELPSQYFFIKSFGLKLIEHADGIAEVSS